MGNRNGLTQELSPESKRIPGGLIEQPVHVQIVYVTTHREDQLSFNVRRPDTESIQ